MCPEIAGSAQRQRFSHFLGGSLIDSTLASGAKSGYTFTVSNCNGTTKNNYQYTSAPVSPGPPGSGTSARTARP